MLSTQEKARLAWHCRRGMLELDLILQRFLKNGLDKLTTEEIKTFNSLLENTDPELFSWLMGNADPLDRELYKIVNIIRNTN